METGGGYALLGSVAEVVQVLAWIGIVVGAFLRGTRAHGVLSAGAEGVGWVAWAAASLVSSQQAAHEQYSCAMYGEDCITSDTQFRSYLWRYLLRGMVVDLLLGAVTDLIGWGAGTFWRRRRAAPGPA